MSYVIAAPEMMTSAASDLATIGSDVSAAHLAAATPTVSLIPAAADEVSAAVTHLFSQHAANYQALAGQAAAFQQQFVQHLTASASSFAHAEAANTALFHRVTAAQANPIGTIVGLPGQLLGLLQLFPNNPASTLLFLELLPIEIPFILFLDAAANAGAFPVFNLTWGFTY
jgi:hypothetical protein